MTLHYGWLILILVVAVVSAFIVFPVEPFVNYPRITTTGSVIQPNVNLQVNWSNSARQQFNPYDS